MGHHNENISLSSNARDRLCGTKRASDGFCRPSRGRPVDPRHHSRAAESTGNSQTHSTHFGRDVFTRALFFSRYHTDMQCHSRNLQETRRHAAHIVRPTQLVSVATCLTELSFFLSLSHGYVMSHTERLAHGYAMPLTEFTGNSQTHSTHCTSHPVGFGRDVFTRALFFSLSLSHGYVMSLTERLAHGYDMHSLSRVDRFLRASRKKSILYVTTIWFRS